MRTRNVSEYYYYVQRNFRYTLVADHVVGRTQTRLLLTTARVYKLYLINYTYKQGDSDVISSYNRSILYQLIFRHDVRQAVQNVRYCDITSLLRQ